MKYAVLFLVLIVAACSRREEAIHQDTLLTSPAYTAPAGPPHVDTASGLWIDSSVVRQQADMQVLKRFTPVQVVQMYLAYKPLRSPSTTSDQVDSFLKAQKITERELHSVLAEGDRLGWSGKPAKP